MTLSRSLVRLDKQGTGQCGFSLVGNAYCRHGQCRINPGGAGYMPIQTVTMETGSGQIGLSYIGQRAASTFAGGQDLTTGGSSGAGSDAVLTDVHGGGRLAAM